MKGLFDLRSFILMIAGYALLTAAALAQTQGSPPDQQGGADRPHGPPPEAISACQGKSDGAACTFTGRQGEQLTGTCFSPPARPPAGQQGPNSMVKHADSSPRPMACRPPRRNN